MRLSWARVADWLSTNKAVPFTKSLDSLIFLLKLSEFYIWPVRFSFLTCTKCESISRNCIFEHIKSLQCYDQEVQPSPFFAHFAIDLCCIPLVWEFLMCTDVERAADFKLSSLWRYARPVLLDTPWCSTSGTMGLPDAYLNRTSAR